MEWLAEYAGEIVYLLFPAPESAHAQDAFVTVDFALSQPYVCLSLVAEGSMDTIWWSTTSLSQRNTHRP